ncbi:hypothetical protein KJ885_02170 [Patescibacteria group bacterium]|nr:hypothetical protein [Patescibacteria group bacterium]
MQKKKELAEDFIERRSEVFKKNLNKYNKSKEDKYLKWLPDINRKGKYGLLKEAWTFMVQHNLEEKIFIIERFKRIKKGYPITHKKLKIGDIEYRFGYYMVGKNGKRENMWTWGESCPIIPHEDLMKLINKAKKEGTIK